MSRVSPIQESFSSGEISKNVRGRVSSDAYESGLKFCENWVPQVQGALRMRDGSMFRDDMDSRNNVARLFTFSVGLDQDKIIEVGDAFIIARDSNSGLQTTGGESINLVVDPTYQSEETFWKFQRNFYNVGSSGAGIISWQHSEDSFTEQVVTSPEFVIIITFPETMVGGEIRQKIQVPAGTDIINHNFTIDYLLSMTDCDKGDMGAPNFSDCEVVIRVGTTETGTEIANDITAILDVGSGNVSFAFIPGAGVTEYWLGLGVRWDAPAGTIPPLDPFDCGDIGDIFNFKFGPVSVTTALPGGTESPVEFVSPFDAQDLLCMHYAMDPGEKELWLTSKSHNIEPRRIKFDSVVWNLDALSAIGGFAAPSPNVWGPNNYPSTVSIRHGRLFLGNVPTQPATIWGSRAGDHVDFDNSGAVNPDDPVLFPLSAAGQITSLANKKQLIINTDVSEIVGESSLPGSVIAFNDFGFPLQSEWGASCVQPVGIGRQLIYSGPSDKKLRTFEDGGGTNSGWDGMELNLLAQDLFGTRVIEIHWADDPSYQLLCVMGNGTIVAATYYYKEGVIGFYRLTTNGLIKSLTVANTVRGATVWALVERNGTWRLEELTFNSGGRHAVDSWVFKDISVVGVITGLSHLDDQLVSIVVQAVDPVSGDSFHFIVADQTVVSGSITLTESAAFGQKAYVGLKYTNSFQLLSRDGVSQMGTSQSTTRRWHKMFLRLDDSAIPLVEGQPAKDRTPASLMGLGEPFISKDVEVVNLGSGEGDLTISQDKPLISQVVAIFGRLVSKEP